MAVAVSAAAVAAVLARKMTGKVSNFTHFTGALRR